MQGLIQLTDANCSNLYKTVIVTMSSLSGVGESLHSDNDGFVKFIGALG